MNFYILLIYDEQMLEINYYNHDDDNIFKELSSLVVSNCYE